MTAQTSYAINQGIAYAGQLFALGDQDIVSRDVESTTIEFGLAVSRGTDADKQAVLGGAAFLGISVRSLEREGAASTGETSYSQGETAGILRKGYIWAICPTGCVPGDQVNYNTTTGALDSGAAGAGETDIAGATWETTTAAGQLGVVRLDS